MPRGTRRSRRGGPRGKDQTFDGVSRGSVVDAEPAVPRSRHQPRELRLADVNERRVIAAFEIDVGTTLLWRDGSIRRSAQHDTLARARLVRQAKQDVDDRDHGSAGIRR